VGSPSLFGRKRPFISPNSSASIENVSSSERTRARARANHAINDAHKGCAMQLNHLNFKEKKFLKNFPNFGLYPTKKEISDDFQVN